MRSCSAHAVVDNGCCGYPCTGGAVGYWSRYLARKLTQPCEPPLCVRMHAIHCCTACQVLKVVGYCRWLRWSYSLTLADTSVHNGNHLWHRLCWRHCTVRVCMSCGMHLNAQLNRLLDPSNQSHVDVVRTLVLMMELLTCSSGNVRTLLFTFFTSVNARHLGQWRLWKGLGSPVVHLCLSSVYGAHNGVQMTVSDTCHVVSCPLAGWTFGQEAAVLHSRKNVT